MQERKRNVYKSPSEYKTLFQVQVVPGVYATAVENYWENGSNSTYLTGGRRQDRAKGSLHLGVLYDPRGKIDHGTIHLRRRDCKGLRYDWCAGMGS